MADYTKHLIGLSGEMAVAKSLCEQNFVPTLASNNSPMFDVFCLNPILQKSIVIQVKTIKDKKGNKVTAFPLLGNRDKRTAFYNEVVGPFVFVHIDLELNYRYFILSKKQFVDLSSKVESDYDVLPRKKPLKPGNPMTMPMKHILDFENQWDNLWK